MSKLTFTVNTETPVLLRTFLRSSCGVSAGLIRRMKSREYGLTCNGEPIRTVDTVKRGDVIVLDSGETGSSVVPNGELSAAVVFENEYVVVFDKPAGMPVHPSVKHRDDTLGNLFAHLYPSLTFRPVNRLDKDTSGLCLIAKDPHSANVLQGNIAKTYYAAAEGITDRAGTIAAPIARERESIIIRCVREDGRAAVTHYRRLCTSEKYSLLEIELETGRTHQIRVHFSHIGHPLAGDDLYGGHRGEIARHALHCGKMTFSSPVTGEKISLTAAIPEDIKKLFGGDLPCLP